MKTKCLITIIGTIIAFSVTAKAQFAFVEPSKKVVPAYLRTVKENVTEPSYYNNISTRAIRNFVMDFPEVSNENWFCTQDLFVAMFTLNDVNYRIDYDRKGNWIETFRTYNEGSLPDDVKQSVKGSYYDYDIYLVQEIQQPFHPNVYIIHLEGTKRLINLQVCNGVINEWQNLKNQNKY